MSLAPACGSKTLPSHSHTPEAPAKPSGDTTPTRTLDSCRSSISGRDPRPLQQQNAPDAAPEATHPPTAAAKTRSHGRFGESCSSQNPDGESKIGPPILPNIPVCVKSDRLLESSRPSF